jgi:hypothetical protein
MIPAGRAPGRASPARMGPARMSPAWAVAAQSYSQSLRLKTM